jgi:hypothetical protein
VKLSEFAARTELETSTTRGSKAALVIIRISASISTQDNTYTLFIPLLQVPIGKFCRYSPSL